MFVYVYHVYDKGECLCARQCLSLHVFIKLAQPLTSSSWIGTTASSTANTRSPASCQWQPVWSVCSYNTTTCKCAARSYLWGKCYVTSCCQRDTRCCCCCCWERSFSSCLEGHLKSHTAHRQKVQSVQTQSKGFILLLWSVSTCIHGGCFGNELGAEKRSQSGGNKWQVERKREKRSKWSKARASGDVPVLSEMRGGLHRRGWHICPPRSNTWVFVCCREDVGLRLLLSPPISFTNNQNPVLSLFSFFSPAVILQISPGLGSEASE